MSTVPRAYERLAQCLGAFAETVPAANHSTAPTAGVAAYLAGEAARLCPKSEDQKSGGTAPSSEASPLPEAVTLRVSALRLTQLARTLDGLPLNAEGAPTTVQVEAQRAVVLAAWQLLQALDRSAAPNLDRQTP